MNDYQVEQLEALYLIRRHLETMDAAVIHSLENRIAEYLVFRRRTAEFLHTYFSGICTEKCYQSRLSACCSRDGIITFFADMVINVLNSAPVDLDRMEEAVKNPADPARCIYLSSGLPSELPSELPSGLPSGLSSGLSSELPSGGCLWKIKPVVCEFFLCHEAARNVFDKHAEASGQWEKLKDLKKSFTWPDRPGLFEFLEKHFIARGCDSPLMYMHKSPGLVRIRRQRNDQ